MRKFLAVVLAVVLLLVMVTGCSQPGSPSQEGNDKGADERPVKIGIYGTTQNLFYSKMAQIIQEHCKARGVECIVSDENNDVTNRLRHSKISFPRVVLRLSLLHLMRMESKMLIKAGTAVFLL